MSTTFKIALVGYTFVNKHLDNSWVPCYLATYGVNKVPLIFNTNNGVYKKTKQY